jgi:hypothetical protein
VSDPKQETLVHAPSQEEINARLAIAAEIGSRLVHPYNRVVSGYSISHSRKVVEITLSCNTWELQRQAVAFEKDHPDWTVLTKVEGKP